MTLERKNINPTLQQFLHSPQITIIKIKMNKGIQNSYHHILQNLKPKTQKVHFLTMRKTDTILAKTTTIIKFINHKNSQIFLRTRKNMFHKHLNQQIIMIINLKNKTIMKKNMCHIIVSKMNMNKYHPSNITTKIMSKLQTTLDQVSKIR